MEPLATFVLLLSIFGVLFLPRKWATTAMLVGTLYLGVGAGLEVFGLNFFPARILSYLCFLRVFLRGEFSFTQLTKPDKALITLYLFTTAILLSRPDESIPLRMAKILDVLLAYFAFRGLVRNIEEFKWVLGVFIVLLIPFVTCLFIERVTGRNLLVLVGAEGKSWLRDDTRRCFGSFRHPSLLGSVGGCFLPLYIALIWKGNKRWKGVLGAALCLAIVVFANSGGPMSVVAAAIAGWLLWPLRTRMYLFRRGLVMMILLLAIVMKAPIWYLLARLSSVTGGSGWHRSYLMDVAFRNLEKWWLVGIPLKDTAGWFPYNLSSTGGADVTNQFLGFGFNAGLIAIGLFIFLIYRCFSILGTSMAILRKTEDIEPFVEPLYWGLGVALAAHVANWLGITYYDQFNTLWLLQLAALVTVSDSALRDYHLNETKGVLISSSEHLSRPEAACGAAS